MKGIVKWFNNEKGYGFIQYTDEEDIFVHYSAINQDGYKTLAEGQLVEFQLIETSKGLQALNVTTICVDEKMFIEGKEGLLKEMDDLEEIDTI